MLLNQARTSRIFRWSVSSMAAALAAALLFPSTSAGAQKAVSIPEEIEWTWEVRPQHPDPKLSNVLILGDSISRAYFPQITKDLTGIANVYLIASSTSVGDPRLPRQIKEFADMEDVRFSVVHFNNGMHGWAYSEEQYKAAFPAFLHAVKDLIGNHGALIWTTTTPVRADATGGATNPRVNARNAIAGSLVRAAGIPTDDQHALMMQHQDLHEDPVHFNATGASLQGDQAAASIKTALKQ